MIFFSTEVNQTGFCDFFLYRGNKTGKDKEESAAEYEFESLSGPQSARYDLSKEKDSFEDKNSSVNFDSSVPYVSSEYGSDEESKTSE